MRTQSSTDARVSNSEKRPLASDVRTVVIYATAPVKRIVGEFTVDRILVASPKDLWGSVSSIGGIDKPAYDAYYADSKNAAGILVSAHHRYATPIPLAALEPQPAVPQSFSYLSEMVLKQLTQLGSEPPTSMPARLPLAVGQLLRPALRVTSAAVCRCARPSLDLNQFVKQTATSKVPTRT